MKKMLMYAMVCGLAVVSSQAASDIVVTLRSGEVIRLPLDPADIASLRFQTDDTAGERDDSTAAPPMQTSQGGAYTGECSSLADLELLPPGHWCVVPNSDYTQRQKMPSEYDDYDARTMRSEKFDSIVGYVSAVVKAWSGGVYDTNRNRLMIWGGGHNDYGGNEVYAFDVATMDWSRITDPTPFPARCEQINSDGTPVARHTYGGLAFLDDLGAMFALGGAPDCGPGLCGADIAWLFDPSDTSWTVLETSGERPRTHCDDQSVYDPEDDRVYYYDDGWYDLNLQDSRWTRHSTYRSRLVGNVALDPKRKRILEVKGNETRLYNVRRGFSFRELNSGQLPFVTGRPGLIFDPVSNTFRAWGGGIHVFELSLEDATWRRLDVPATNAAFPGEIVSSGGVYGRFRYVPFVDRYILLKASPEGFSVFFYRPARA